jgi:hypothetical protein
MAEVQHEELGMVVDIGEDIYNLDDSQSSILLAYGNLKAFQNAFDNTPRTKYLIRKYLPFVFNKDDLSFEFKDGEAEKNDLVGILHARLKKLKSSIEATRSTNYLKDSKFRRYYDNILKLIEKIRNEDTSESDKPEKSEKCKKDLEYTKKLSKIRNGSPESKENEEKMFKIMIGIAWYLLNPNKVPDKIQCEWASIIQSLDTFTIGNIIQEIQAMKKDDNDTTLSQPLNYFKRMTLSKLKGVSSSKKVGEKVKDMVLEENTTQQMKDYLVRILKLLKMKEYLVQPFNNSNNPVIKVAAAADAEIQTLERQMITNPLSEIVKDDEKYPISENPVIKPIMSGGWDNTLSLKTMMMPLFNYFKMMYDPIYTFLDDDISRVKVKYNIIPELLQVLHLTNKIKENIPDKSNYGIYKIKNVSKNLCDFIDKRLNAMKDHVDSIRDSDLKGRFIDNKQRFIKQLAKLPTMQIVSSVPTKTTLSPSYLQFLRVGENIDIPDKNQFIDPTKKPPTPKEMYEAITEFFTKDALYILCTTSSGEVKKEFSATFSEIPITPMKLFEVDLNLVNITLPDLPKIDTLPNNYFTKYPEIAKNPDFALTKIIPLNLTRQYNNSELALSILILFKEKMP